MGIKEKEELDNTEDEVIEITAALLNKKLYEVRGFKVMLDTDLAKIYGYETKNFNRQVKNNAEKFEGDEFMFQLTKDEYDEILRCKNFTSSWGGSRYVPYAFTEQGVYMLMTVLKGDLAVKQSRALVRTFKKMKDYIISNQNLISQREMMQLSMQTAENKMEITKLRMDLGSVEKQMSDVMDQLGDVVTKSDLADMMNGFVNDTDNGWLMYNTKYCSADIAYSSIYSQAKKSIYLVDNYIGLRTLVLLKNANANIEIKVFSDNVGNGKLHNVEYKDFCKEYPAIKITMQRTGGVFHDRFIVLDYGTKNERVFLCGASSKDAGARITSIVEDFGIQKYEPIIQKLSKNATLVLP
ncbi:ORF6N domain-containing protein [Butyrivibrio sp. INlla18]|uniref:ORF6N domain-containing protein n=1 Tax=Butyrivibrio sp. INlla18 TaxID=1520806 RepID=UPI00087E0A90|nr:ORF6N domain-containing protein [Butyrivibrio sp. INlla18]SDA78675.1 ORF6N domain-containing protein [Butyrivibrio sp. INlla18]